MSTDPAVTVEFVARQLWHAADDFGGPEDWLDDAAQIVTRIEAEVRERIAAEIEASVADHTPTENEEWTKVCRKCWAIGNPGYWPCTPVRHAEDAARIARGTP